MPKYSVIVPVYNVKEYLAECVESVLNQKGEPSLELLLVDDGSTDGSGSLCDEWAEKDGRVRVIHQQNAGVSAARNRGMEEAQGEYILFLDSDDYWLPELLACAETLVGEKPDVFLMGTCRFNENGVVRHFVPAYLPEGQSGQRYLEELFAQGNVPEPFVCAYGYRRNFLDEHELRFNVRMRSSEDFDFHMRALPLAKSIRGTAQTLYQYRVREGSLSKTLSAEKLMANLRSKQEQYRRFPCEALARLYVGNAALISWIGSRRAAKEAIEHVRNNRDILRSVHLGGERWKALLLQVLGPYSGSLLYWKLWHLRHGKNQSPW